jgi:hypothetical protein
MVALIRSPAQVLLIGDRALQIDRALAADHCFAA